MAHTVVQNTREGEQAPAAPSHPDGREWAYEMIYAAGDNRAYADTPTDLLDALIDGYSTLDGTAQAHARISLAQSARVTMQATFIAERGDGLTPEQRDILNTPQTPHTGPWDSLVPLVVLTSDYQPYTDLPRPIGLPGANDALTNIAWIDVSTDETLIETLHTLGFITVGYDSNANR